jgi:hypothetical protein
MTEFKCEFCKSIFSCKRSLKYHQKNAKYCLKIQGKDNATFTCTGCNKSFYRKFVYQRHIKKCKKTEKLVDQEKKITELTNLLSTKNLYISNLLSNKNLYEKNITTMKCDYKELLDSYQRLAELYVMDGKNKIEGLNKKFLKKRGRTKYKDQNVIYILTTPGLKKERRYILGKATNLTNRLSTYNKTDEHEVVFYSSCPNKEKMSLVEGMVFDKLEVYREQANRERFILPVDRKIDLFSGTIKKCIDFVK